MMLLSRRHYYYYLRSYTDGRNVSVYCDAPYIIRLTESTRIQLGESRTAKESVIRAWPGVLLSHPEPLCVGQRRRLKAIVFLLLQRT